MHPKNPKRTLEMNNQTFFFAFIGIQVVDKAVGLELRIIKFPLINAVSVEVQKQLQRYVLSTVVRMQQK